MRSIWCSIPVMEETTIEQSAKAKLRLPVIHFSFQVSRGQPIPAGMASLRLRQNLLGPVRPDRDAFQIKECALGHRRAPARMCEVVKCRIDWLHLRILDR